MSKYHNKPQTVDGLRFDSKKEMKRYGELRLMEKAGLISNLVFHPRFILDVNNQHICDYEADFRYKAPSAMDDVSGYKFGIEVVEDCKGMKTPVYRLKKKLMKAIHGIEVKET